MATVTRRKDGRFEIRESVVTEAGPRSRTLATFTILSPEVIEFARRRATRPFDGEAVRRRAEELEVPWVGHYTAAEALRLMATLRTGTLPPTFAAALREETAALEGQMPDSIPPMLDWIDADDDKRGRALRDLLRLGDSIVKSRGVGRSGPLRYPRLPRK